MRSKVLLALGLTVLVGQVGAVASAHEHGATSQKVMTPGSFQPGASFRAVCVGVEEADLISVKPDGSEVEEVYLLGSDTPEPGQGAWTDKAREVTKSLILDKPVRVVLDKQPRANCGRLRAYIHLPDGTFLNLKLIEQGYASVLSKAPNLAHDAEFKRAEREARDKGVGIWDPKSGLSVLPGAYRKLSGAHATPPAHACDAEGNPIPKR
jgi:micrococcal nuclease